MQQDLVRPAPTKKDIKDNLIKYSPFYRQAMHFDKAEVQTLFYVAHGNFSSEKALKKLEAFGLFKDKKIGFVEFRVDERGPVRDSVGDGNVEGALAQPRGNSAHFTVKVKDKDSYASKELEISADGKCGIASSFVALNEILRGDTPLSPEVLLRDDKVASGPPQNGDIVQSDPNNPFDVSLDKIYKPKVVKDEEGKDKYEDDVKLHHCVKNDFTSESPKFEQIFGSLPQPLKERVKRLLKETPESDWLEPKHVHEILTTNLNVNRLINQGQLQNISAGNIFSFHAAIPATVVAEDFRPPAIATEEPITPPPEVSLAPNADNHTLTRAGLPNEGMELEPDKTLKHEFRIIVLNILHEWIEGKDCEFSKINEDKFLESLIKDKLGDEYAQKIRQELGGQITFKSLLAIEEDLSPQVAFSPTSPTLPSIPEEPITNQTDQLEKEREAFYSAPCGNDKKVFEKILDIAKKFCQDSSCTGDEYSENEVILLEDFIEVLKNFTNLSLDEPSKIKLAEIKSLIEKLENKQFSDFTYEIDGRLAIKLNAGGAHAHAQPADAQPDYSYRVQINAGHKLEVTEEDLKKAFPAVYSINTQAFEMYTFSPDSINEGLLERRASGTQTLTAVASAQTIPYTAATGCDFACNRAQAENARGRILGADAPPAPAPAPAPRAHAHAPAPTAPAHAPTSNPPQAKPNQDVDKFGGLMEAAVEVINKAFDELGNAIKSSCEEARKNLLKKVDEIEKSETKSPKEQGKHGDQHPETPDSNILTPIFSALRSCLGDRNKSP